MNWYCFREWIEGNISEKNELKMNLNNADGFKNKLQILIAFIVKHDTVYKFVNLFLHRLFGNANKYWGLGEENHRKFNKFIGKLISGVRHIKFTMADVIDNMSTINVFDGYILKEDKNFSIHNKHIKWQMLIGLACWIINDIVIDMLRFNYYITESSYKEGSATTYYGCKVWRHIVSMYLKQNEQMFQIISKQELHIKKKDTDLGIGFLRFVPKPNSLRPIINQSRHSFVHDGIGNRRKLIAPNKKLNQLFSVLTHTVNKYKMNNKKQDILGSSVFCVR
eukprot:416919_1